MDAKTKDERLKQTRINLAGALSDYTRTRIVDISKLCTTLSPVHLYKSKTDDTRIAYFEDVAIQDSLAHSMIAMELAFENLGIKIDEPSLKIFRRQIFEDLLELAWCGKYVYEGEEYEISVDDDWKDIA